jgi:transcriptional regulator with XRE-family HTH domain
MASKTGRPTADAVEILRRRYVDGNPEAEAVLDEVRADADVARAIYRLRTEAGLTQQALAKRIGTTASVISRLEDADYTGHSLAMLRRIAATLGRRVEIRFPAVKRDASANQGRGNPIETPPLTREASASPRRSKRVGHSAKKKVL